MNINIEVKIKMDKGKEIILKNDEAKELFLKLKEIYEKEKTTEYVPWYPYYPYIPPTTYEYVTTTELPVGTIISDSAHSISCNTLCIN